MKKVSKYAKLLKAKSGLCSGKTTKTQFNAVAKEYVKDTVEKGNKTQKQAEAIVAKMEKNPCAIGAVKKRKTVTKARTKTKTTKRKRA